MSRYAGLFVLLACLCLIGQQAFGQRVSACSHAFASAAGDATHAHHGHADGRSDSAPQSGGCECGCACASVACVHASVPFALPAAAGTPEPAPHDLPRFAWAAPGAAQAAVNDLLRPPIRS